MMLDTNALSAMAERDPVLLEVLSATETLTLPYITMAEFHYGLLGSIKPAAGLALLGRLAETIPVLFPDFATVGHYARISDELKRKGRTIPHNDLWLAALSLQHGLAILSRDKHFDFVDGIQRVSW